jgi:hypothetical protein
MVGCLTNIYYLTVGHLTENFLKKSNALHMPDPAPSLGLNIERTTISQTLSELVVLHHYKILLKKAKWAFTAIKGILSNGILGPTSPWRSPKHRAA